MNEKGTIDCNPINRRGVGIRRRGSFVRWVLFRLRPFAEFARSHSHDDVDTTLGCVRVN